MKCKVRVPREVRVKIVCSGILFSAFDNPFFKDYTKILNPGYDPSKRTTLASSILDSEAANIIIKVENELSKAKNLTLCIDTNFNAEKIIEVLENVGPEKFIAIVSDTEMSMIAAKKQVLEQEAQIFSHANSVKNLINDRQFWIDIKQLRNILGPAK
ncbi:10377_t:CDS:2 [Cetraspora pellucida]|uniref:10377_t:CDS:1 n=1 Tax=Cetraspora pellucida TaxID=1433469 RepID=A0A9N9A3A9_9GLOM|nr:10377_t:CDS:2 [Cetraspora pellucida]